MAPQIHPRAVFAFARRKAPGQFVNELEFTVVDDVVGHSILRAGNNFIKHSNIEAGDAA